MLGGNPISTSNKIWVPRKWVNKILIENFKSSKMYKQKVF